MTSVIRFPARRSAVVWLLQPARAAGSCRPADTAGLHGDCAPRARKRSWLSRNLNFPIQGGNRMTPQDLLAAHNINLASTAPGRHYTTCPQCSAKRSKAHQKNKVLGVTVDANGAHWGCNHCGWTGPEKGTGTNGSGNGRGSNNLTTYDYQEADGTVTFQKVRAYDKDGKKFFWLRDPMAMAAGSKVPQTSTPRCSIACPRLSRRSATGK